MTAMEHGTRSRTTRLVTLAAAAAAALIAGAAGPAAAAPKEPLSYVALGDSYASGFGAPSPDPANPYGFCGRSPLGLPGILDGKKQVELVANETCAGATVAPAAGGAVDLPEQVDRAIDAGTLTLDTDLVTISAGGNDAGFTLIAGACATSSATDCAALIAGQTRTVLPVLEDRLDALYDDIASAAPNATVVVTGYPHLFSPEFGNPIIVGLPTTAGIPTIPVASQTAFNAGTDALNTVIRRQAEEHGFTFVDLVPKFEGHGLGSPDPWITLQPNAIDNLHPTAEGYKSGYFPAVRSAVNFSQLQR